jgi:hypothetical protein
MKSRAVRSMICWLGGGDFASGGFSEGKSCGEHAARVTQQKPAIAEALRRFRAEPSRTP